VTIWQSIGLVTPAQWAYGIGLALLFWWRGPSLVAWTLLAGFVATLAIAAAMDFGVLSKSDARMFMLIVWLATAAAMAVQPGPAQIIAAVSVFSIVIFAAGLYFELEFRTTAAIVSVGSFIILAVAIYEMGDGGSSGFGRRGPVGGPHPVGLPAGDEDLGERGMAQGAGLLSQDRRGVE
jgi:hypothetical protein